MKKLTDIVWPFIRNAATSEIERIRALEVSCRPTVVVLEAAVLLEAKWQDLVDEVWVLGVAKSKSIRRLMSRNHITESDALKRIESQMSLQERQKFADVLLDNNGSLDETKQQVDTVKAVHSLYLYRE